MSNLIFDGQNFKSLKEIEAYKSFMKTLGFENEYAVDEDMILESLDFEDEDEFNYNIENLDSRNFENFEGESVDGDYKSEDELIF
jgi:hypothetical protein